MNLDCHICDRCGEASAEVRILGCGCTIHARCFPVSDLYKQFEKDVVPPRCPCCHQNKMEGLYLFPISLKEFEKSEVKSQNSEHRTDEAGKNVGKSTLEQHTDSCEEHLDDFYAAIEPIFHTNSSKIENNSISTATNEEIQFRNGRWTAEEVKLIDDLMDLFNGGKLPIPNGTILNDFLRSMFLCKSTRLRKKIKNANFCTRTYKANTTSSVEISSANSLSKSTMKLPESEKNFLGSIESENDRQVLKFNMSRIWVTYFVNLCLQQHGFNSLHADDWLSSLEMIEKKSNQAKDSKKQVARKKRIIHSSPTESIGNNMMNTVELMNIVDIQHNPSLTEISFYNHQNRQQSTGSFLISRKEAPPSTPSFEHMTNEYANESKRPRLVKRSIPTETKSEVEPGVASAKCEAENLCEQLADWSPFIDKITNFLQEEHLPFSYCDVWIASDQEGEKSDEGVDVTSDNIVEIEKKVSTPSVRLRHVGHGVPNDTESIFTLYHMNEFGKYSKKFAFPPGIGLPGRVLKSGVPTWDDCVQKCSLTDFPRVSGAKKYGVKKALGIPLLNSSVGKIVVAMYTSEDIGKDVGIVQKCCAQFQEFNPISTWQLSLGLGSSNLSFNPMTTSDQPTRQTIRLDKIPNESSGKLEKIEQISDISDLSIEIEDTPNINQDEIIINLLGRYAPSCDSLNARRSQLGQNFTALRLLLLRSPKERTANENSMICTINKSYNSYLRSNRKEEEIAVLLAYDYQFMSGNQMVTSNTHDNVTTITTTGAFGSGNPNAPVEPVDNRNSISSWDQIQPT